MLILTPFARLCSLTEAECQARASVLHPPVTEAEGEHFLIPFRLPNFYRVFKHPISYAEGLR